MQVLFLYCILHIAKKKTARWAVLFFGGEGGIRIIYAL